MTSTCSEHSVAVGEPLAATATQGSEWLLVEVRGAWGRDAINESGLASAVRDRLGAYPGKVVLIRRPDRRDGCVVIRAEVREDGGSVTRNDLASVEQLVTADLPAGDAIAGPVFIVCIHGRRDACCARLGAPLYEALRQRTPPEQLWQASHLGGHRFAPNVVVLPLGIQLGRIPLDRVGEVYDTVTDGRIPLDLYRGRTLYAPRVQAAEIAARAATGCDAVDGLALSADDGDSVTFTAPFGDVTIRVEQRVGPAAPASCGAEPEPTVLWVASLESAA
ncbi:sucrase ferredoxin [Gaiella sp.]|uniref:sucrase ferredoxin n=1 Tax=Gaiella sp. TaxID=2663207 RepID=UPI003265FD18